MNSSLIEAFSVASMKLGLMIESPNYKALEVISLFVGIGLLFSVFFIFSSETYLFAEMTLKNQFLYILGILAVLPILLRLLIGELFAIVIAFIFAVVVLPLYIVLVIYRKITNSKSKL